MLSWVSVNANTGSIVADLTNLRVDGALKRTIGRHEAQSAILPLDKVPSNWRAATRKKSVFLVALDEFEQPVWGGMVTDRTTSHKEGVPLSLATAEDYFNDRYVGNETYAGWGQNDIVEDLVLKYAATGDKPGIPIRVEKLPGDNPPRDRTYLDQDDKTLFSVLEELSGIIGGPEWTIGWEWVDEDKLGLVLYVGARIGAAAPTGLGSATQFNLPGNVKDVQLIESYKRGEGANDVMASSSGSADARPQSSRHVNEGDGRPTVEFRWSPSSSITDISTLDSHAERALTGLQDGLMALAITVNRTSTTQAFGIGDDVGFDLVSWAWPDGIRGTARAIAVEYTDTTITPVLDVTGIEGIN